MENAQCLYITINSTTRPIDKDEDEYPIATLRYNNIPVGRVISTNNKYIIVFKGNASEEQKQEKCYRWGMKKISQEFDTLDDAIHCFNNNKQYIFENLFDDLKCIYIKENASLKKRIDSLEREKWWLAECCVRLCRKSGICSLDCGCRNDCPLSNALPNTPHNWSEGARLAVGEGE